MKPSLSVIVLLLSMVAMPALVLPSPVSAELSDDTGSYGVANPDLSFGIKPDASVASMISIGNLVFVGGKFTEVTRNRTVISNRSYLAAFDATTGAYVPSFSAIVDGPVNAMAEYQGKLLIGGKFGTVNGQNVKAIALLDPVTGETEALPFRLNGGAPAGVRGFDQDGGFLYVTGVFNRAVGNNGSHTVKNAARFVIATGEVDTNWAPALTGSGWSIAADPANSRVYVAAFQGQGLISLDAATGAIVGNGWVGGGMTRPYDLVVHRGKIWIVGNEHALFVLDAASLTVERYHYSGQAGQANPWNGGEYQALFVDGDRVYASCHCNYETRLVGENIRRPISFLVAFDANTGLHIPSFDPHLLGDSGPWAITKGPDGCIWTGGDLRKSGATKVDGIARLCDITNLDGQNLVNLAPAATFSSGPGYYQLDLGSTRAIADIEVHASIGDNFILVSERPFRNDKSPAQLAGMSGYHGTRVIRSDNVNRRWFSTHARYVRVYTSSSVNKSQIFVNGSAQGPVVDTERPSKPTSMVLVAGLDRVDLAWTASTDNVGVTGYNVYRSESAGGAFALVGTSSSTSYADTNLVDGSYWYYLRAVDGAGNVSWRNGTRSATVGGAADTERPSKPTSMVLVAGLDRVDLAWTASTDNVGVTGYNVYRSESAGGAFALVGTSSSTSYADTNLVDGSYWYYLRAVDGAGNVSWRNGTRSATVGGAVDTERPTTPRGLRLASVDATSVSLGWTASTDNVGVLEYQIFDGGVLVRTSTNPSLIISGLNSGSTHSYWVKAIDVAGNTSWRSNQLSVTLP